MHNFWLCSSALHPCIWIMLNPLRHRFVRLLGWQCAVCSAVGCGIRDLEWILQEHNVDQLHTGALQRSVKKALAGSLAVQWWIDEFNSTTNLFEKHDETSSHQDCGPQGRCPTSLVMASATLSQHHPVISAMMRIQMEVSRNVIKVLSDNIRISGPVSTTNKSGDYLRL